MIKTLQIDEELHRELKVTVAIFGRSMIEATAEAIRTWIDDRMQQLQEQEQESECTPTKTS